MRGSGYHRGSDRVEGKRGFGGGEMNRDIGGENGKS